MKETRDTIAVGVCNEKKIRTSISFNLLLLLLIAFIILIEETGIFTKCIDKKSKGEAAVETLLKSLALNYKLN